MPSVETALHSAIRFSATPVLERKAPEPRLTPTGTGSGGPGYVIKGEFTANGFTNDLEHTRGVISMARMNKPMDSAGCQFFICHQDSPHLNGQYAAFGRVISGMEVVDAIANVAVNPVNYRPLESVVIKSITIEGPELPDPEKLPDIR